MIYLPDKNTRSGGNERILVPVALFVLLAGFLFLVPHSADFLAKHAAGTARVVVGDGSVLLENMRSFRALLSEKDALLAENESFRKAAEARAGESAELEALAEENRSLKELLGRKGNASRTLGKVLLRPNRSPYDTFLIDIGSVSGLSGGERVFAGPVFIGVVGEVYETTARVILHSSPGGVFDVRIKSADVVVTGRGGGSFEGVAPKALGVAPGDEVIVPSLGRLLLGRVSAVIADPRDPLERVLIDAPVSLFKLSEVLVEFK